MLTCRLKFRSEVDYAYQEQRAFPIRTTEGSKPSGQKYDRINPIGYVEEQETPARNKRNQKKTSKLHPTNGGEPRVTLIIGAKGSDGIVIGTDQKVMRGGEAHYSNKIQVLHSVAFATEGLTGIADDFFLLLGIEAERKKGFGTLYEAKTIAEDIVSELSKRYKDRLNDASPVGVLMAGLESISYGQAKMYYIHSEGYGETVTFRCTGSGGQYATTLAKFLHKETESAEENARRIAFVIHWISEDVDTRVGGTPQIAMIRNGESKINWLGQEEIDKQGGMAKEKKTNLWQCFAGDG